MTTIATYYPDEGKFVSSAGAEYEVGHYDEDAILIMTKASELVENRCNFKEFVDSIKSNYNLNYKEGVSKVDQ